MVTYCLDRIKQFFNAWMIGAFLLPSFANSAPALFSYQGRILSSSGQGLEYGSVSFEFTVTSPDGSCVIYKEQRDGVDMRNSKGLFDTPIGAGTKIYPTTPGFTLLDAFSNLNPITCSGGVVYTPAPDDSRKLRVQFYDGVGWKLISPDQSIRSVPYAGHAKEAQTAARLGSYPAANYVRRVEFPTCSGTDVLTFNGTTFTCATVGSGGGGGGGTGTVTEITVASPLAVATGTTTPHLTIQPASGTQSGYLTSSDWTTFNSKLSSSSAFAGDVSGTAGATSIDKLKGSAMTFSSLTDGQYLKYNGTGWVNATISQSEVAGLSTTLSGVVMQSQFPASCAASQTLTFLSPSGSFACSSIAINGSQVTGNISGNAAGFTGSLAGDVSGNQGTTSVNRIKGIDVSATAPTANQVLKYTGGAWTPTTLSGSDLPSGTATASGTSGRLAYFNGTNSLADSVLFQSGGNVGIGTTSPQASIDVQSSNAQIRAINSNNNGYATLSATTYGGANVNNSANLNLYRFRGSISSPAAPLNGDQLGVISIYGGTAAGSYTPIQGAKILFTAEEDFSASAAGTGIGFFTQTSGQAGGPTERLHISSNGMVGVGVVSSSDNLQVRGKTGFGYAGVQSGQASFYPANVANTYFHLENKNDNTFRISAGATPGVLDLLTITNGGYVGIGSASPARPLHVVGPMRLTATTTPASPVAGDIFIDSADANKLKWYDGSTWKDAGGAAGASPTTDASALTSGTLSATRLPAFSGDVTSSAGSSSLTLNTVTVAKGGTGATSFDANKLVATNGTGSALVSWACPLGNFIKFDSAGVAGCDTLANILGYTPANGANYVAKAGDTMTGTLNLPSNGLTVGTSQLVVSGGSVGVGVASPGAKLDVVSGSTGSVITGRFASNPGGAGAGNLNALVLDNTSGASNYKNEIKFRGGGNDKWSIGTDPAGAGEQKFYIWDAVNNARRMTIDGNGNMGIGTDSPIYKLDVQNGSMSTANTTTATNFTYMYAYPSSSSATRFIANLAGTETGGATSTITGEILGQASYAKHMSANPLTKLSGSWSGIYHTTNTTVGTGIAAQGEVNNDGVGIINQAVGLHSSIKNNSTGEIVNGYGLYVDAIQATNKWAIYSSDATAKSYFAGKVGIDTATPERTFHVGGASAGANVQTVAQFGDPGSGAGALYMTYNHPNVTGNMHYNGGWKYGGGSGKPAGISFIGGVSIFGSDATPGAKDSAISDIRTFMTISSQGNIESNGYSATAGKGTMILRNTYNHANTRYWQIGPDGNSNGNFVVYTDGNAGAYLVYGQTAWSSSSDRRLKKEILPIEDSLNKLMQLNGVTYLYNKDKKDDPRKAGVIAQDVQKVLPEAVTQDNGYLSVKYTELIPLVINAVKDLAHKFMNLAETQAMQTRGLASVDSEVAKLKKENEQLRAESAKHKQENAAIKSWICGKDPQAEICK